MSDQEAQWQMELDRLQSLVELHRACTDALQKAIVILTTHPDAAVSLASIDAFTGLEQIHEVYRGAISRLAILGLHRAVQKANSTFAPAASSESQHAPASSSLPASRVSVLLGEGTSKQPAPARGPHKALPSDDQQPPPPPPQSGS